MRISNIVLAANALLNIPTDGYFVYLKSATGAVNFRNENGQKIALVVGDKFTFPELIKSIELENGTGVANTIQLIHGLGNYERFI